METTKETTPTTETKTQAAARKAKEKAKATKKAAAKTHKSSTGKYVSGRALVIEMIQAGKFTQAHIHTAWGKEFPDAPAKGYKGYLSWAFDPKMVKRTGGKLVTIDLKTGIISMLGKKTVQHKLADYRKAVKKTTKTADAKKTTRTRKGKTAVAEVKA